MTINKLKCVACDYPVDKTDHPLLVVTRDSELYSNPLAAVHSAALKDAQTIQITLTRKTPSDTFEGIAFRCIESFERRLPPEDADY